MSTTDYVIFTTGYTDRYQPTTCYDKFDYIGAVTDAYDCIGNNDVACIRDAISSQIYGAPERGYLIFRKRPDIETIDISDIKELIVNINNDAPYCAFFEWDGVTLEMNDRLVLENGTHCIVTIYTFDTESG